MLRARPVRPGSLIDAIAPSSAFDREGFLKGVGLLGTLGLRVRYRPDVFTRTAFLAGDDDRRRQELVDAICAPDSDLIWCARGGYGATRIVDAVPPALVATSRKAIVGFSDITALHAVWLRAGVPSVHGSMLARLASEPVAVRDRVLGLVLNDRPTLPLQGQPLVGGRAQGRLTGGNLALLAALCGTRAQPDLEGCIVFVEDTGERPYRIDRMLVQARSAGLLKGIAGLAFGDFTDCDAPDAPGSVAAVIEEHARAMKVPAIRGLPCGHGAINQALPFGVRAGIDGDSGSLTILEDPSAGSPIS